MLCAALDQIFRKNAAKFHLLHALGLQVVGCLNPGLGCALVQLRDQKLVINLVDLERTVILSLPSLSAGGIEVGTRDIILRLEFQVLRERLRQLSSAGGEGVSTLVEDHGPRRNWGVGRNADAARGNCDEL